MSVSKEIQMLLNRMDTHPEEFLYEDELDNARHFSATTGPRWANLLRNLYTDAAHTYFSKEDADALREKHGELVRTAVKQNVVKELLGANQRVPEQLELPYMTPIRITP